MRRGLVVDRIAVGFAMDFLVNAWYFFRAMAGFR